MLGKSINKIFSASKLVHGTFACAHSKILVPLDNSWGDISVSIYSCLCCRLNVKCSSYIFFYYWRTEKENGSGSEYKTGTENQSERKEEREWEHENERAYELEWDWDRKKKNEARNRNECERESDPFCGIISWYSSWLECWLNIFLFENFIIWSVSPPKRTIVKIHILWNCGRD